MANCIECGIHYCDCPTPGYCPTCMNKMFADSMAGSSAPCVYTKEILENFRSVLSRIISKEAGPRVGLQPKDYSFYESYINSALLYPNDPCRYKNVLDSLKSIIELAVAFGI